MEQYEDALECLPPRRWENVRGIELFIMSEAYTSNIHSHYARLGDRCFTRMCRTTEPYAELAAQVVQIIRSTSLITLPA